jgi:hypothetical protein
MHWADGAQRFETWENSYVNVVGLDATDGVTTHDLGRERCAIVTAKVANVDSATVAEALAAQQINVSTTVAEHNQFDTRGARPLAKAHARVRRLVSPTIRDNAQLTTDSTIAAQMAVHQKSSM